MEKINLMGKFPICTKEILKTKTKIKSTNEFIQLLKNKIEEDPSSTFISIFDQYKHTETLWWNIVEWMIWCKIIIFCFWQEIPNALVMALRPRNVAIVEFKDKFVVSFLEAPKDWATNKKISWILEHIED